MLVRVLGLLGDPESLPVVERLLSDPDHRVRANAVEAVVAIAAGRDMHRLVPLLMDPNNRLKANACIALHGRGYHGVREALRSLVSSPRVEERLSAVYAIHQIGVQVASLLGGLLPNPEAEVQQRAEDCKRMLGLDTLPPATFGSGLVRRPSAPHRTGTMYRRRARCGLSTQRQPIQRTSVPRRGTLHSMARAPWKKSDPLFRGDHSGGPDVPDPTATTSIVAHILYRGGCGRKTPYSSTTESDEVAEYFAGTRGRGQVWETTARRAEGEGSKHIPRKQLLQDLKGFGRGKTKWTDAFEVAQAARYVQEWSEHLLDWNAVAPARIAGAIKMTFRERT